ncbi:hypothetical protein Z959_13105 [Clostridium novyi B str. ATCC 27606]|uniref:Uncharacterized protein n=1 Tax=Clostridium novyi B str. ATCC 27606 TaxID=1443123 RepID=A0AA40M4F8_CLONO|nr:MULTISPECIES: ABC transporter permease [Clostridium]KEI06311.1 hypothetical protein Z957_p0087 [Clostridium sp. K25]KEI11804.1 hypothetical protein Z959_13105 [Clostridium novyi B str. ATCC 27606]
MKNYIKTEFKRGFFSKRNKIAILLCFLSMILCVFDNLIHIYPRDDASKLFTYTMAELIVIIAPILACLPFVDSYLNDVESGTLKYIYTKITPMKYAITKILVNGLLGGLVMLIGATLSFLVFLTRGIHVSDSALINKELINIYTKTPFFYIVLIIFFMFIFGFVISTLGLGMSTIITNKYIAILFPFILYMLAGIFLGGINNRLDPMSLLSLDDGVLIYIVLYDLLLFVIGIVLFLTKILRHGDVIE